jgi:hypothetical protein
LVLITWLISFLALISLGLLPTLVLTRSSQPNVLLRKALWWGLLVVLIFAISMSLWAPLGGATTALVLILGTCLIGIPGWVGFAKRRPNFRFERQPWGIWLLGLTALSVTGYLAIAALGPVTNYDSGLYHLGAIRYASEFAAIPGLANLYFPFGYGTAHFPMAALLTNGPWGIEGYRLLNGLVLTMAGVDLVLRSLRRRPGPGFYVLAVGLTATWVPMVALSDYWVTSPSQDSMALTLTVVASAYLADAVAGRRSWTSAGATCVAVATSLTLVRPTMGAYLVGSILVLGVLAVRRRRTRSGVLRATTLALGLGFAALVATTARDRVLSGWFQYPLSFFPFDVPWLASDPSPVREATLGFHRNPEDLWNSVDGWNWIGPWLISRVSQWETYELLALALVAVLSTGWALMRHSSPRLARWIALTTFPSALAVIVWWSLTPPSYRFAWGALFTLFSIPTGWALWSLTTNAKSTIAQRSRLKNLFLNGLTLPVLFVVAFSAAFRLEVESMTQRTQVNVGVAIPIAVAPVPLAPVEEVDLESGLNVVRPIESDQCWWTYPLCTPGPEARLKPLNGPWPRGFTIS